jgi:membrane protease YdiL (CAAX protease family)
MWRFAIPLLPVRHEKWTLGRVGQRELAMRTGSEKQTEHKVVRFLASLPSPAALFGFRLPITVAAWVVVGLAAPYILLNFIFPGPVLSYTLGMALALLAFVTLLLARATPGALGLRIAAPSRQGALILALLLVFIPGALLAGRAQPLGWLNDLVYAPASALAQELYFRAALLDALKQLSRGDTRLALALQAVLFALWHIRAFEVATMAQALAVLALTFLAGVLWGWQVQRDRTILYTFLQHTLFLIVQ